MEGMEGLWQTDGWLDSQVMGAEVELSRRGNKRVNIAARNGPRERGKRC